jgi:diamine N-acetyltransferase
LKNNFHIQKVQLSDLDRINEIATEINLLHFEAHPDIFEKIEGEFSAQKLEEILHSKNEGIIGAYIIDELVGYIYFTIKKRSENKFMNSEEILKVNTLGVSPDYNNIGIGSELLEEVKKYAQKKNIKKIILSVWTFNNNALNFYKKNNFIEVKKEMEFNL